MKETKRGIPTAFLFKTFGVRCGAEETANEMFVNITFLVNLSGCIPCPCKLRTTKRLCFETSVLRKLKMDVRHRKSQEA